MTVEIFCRLFSTQISMKLTYLIWCCCSSVRMIMTICVILMSSVVGAEMADKANLDTGGSWALGTGDGSS